MWIRDVFRKLKNKSTYRENLISTKNPTVQI